MNVAICYIYPLAGADGHIERALRFLDTYHEHPPGLEHQTVVVCNGGPADEDAKFLFGSLPGLRLIEHDDSGMDIGGYQLAARTFPCELMVFFGGNTYFRRRDWLRRVVDSFTGYGDTLYGATGNQGDMRTQTYPHVRTTGFWMPPALLNSYPLRVTRNDQRYEFEHGKTCLTSWVLGQRKRAWVVGWDGVYDLGNCDSMPNGFHRGDQSNVMFGDRLTSPPFYYSG